MNPLPLSKPFTSSAELRYVEESLASGKLSGDGPFTKRARSLLERELSAKQVLLTTSCTSALELAALLLRPMSGDPGEVIVPSFTFVSTVNAFLLHGYTPVFCDVRPETGNLDIETVMPHVTSRTRVIVPVHYAGVPCDMAPILALAEDRGIAVVEDAAQALYARVRGSYAGTLGDLGAFSFHETKNFSCGEGGALVVNRDDLTRRAEIMREKGTNRAQFRLGHVDKYTWVDIGGSFLSADVLAAMLLSQLEARQVISAARARLFAAYMTALAPLAREGHVRLPVVPSGVEANHHLFFVVAESFDARTRLMHHLNAQGIGATFHYSALHTTPMGRSLHRGGTLRGAEELSDRLLRLPLFVGMSEEDVYRVTNAMEDFYLAKRARSA